MSTIEPGGGTGAEPYTHDSDEEVVVVLSGVLDLWVGDEHYVLQRGRRHHLPVAAPALEREPWRRPGHRPLLPDATRASEAGAPPHPWRDHRGRGGADHRAGAGCGHHRRRLGHERSIGVPARAPPPVPGGRAGPVDPRSPCLARSPRPRTDVRADPDRDTDAGPDRSADRAAQRRPRPRPPRRPHADARPDRHADRASHGTPTPGPTATPTPAPTATPAPSHARRPSSPSVNLYRSSAMVRQYTNYWCVPAATQSMVNLVRSTSNRTLPDAEVLLQADRSHNRYAYATRGNDPQGWAWAFAPTPGTPYIAPGVHQQAAAARRDRRVDRSDPRTRWVSRSGAARTPGSCSGIAPAIDPVEPTEEDDPGLLRERAAGLDVATSGPIAT